MPLTTESRPTPPTGRRSCVTPSRAPEPAAAQVQGKRAAALAPKDEFHRAAPAAKGRTAHLYSSLSFVRVLIIFPRSGFLARADVRFGRRWSAGKAGTASAARHLLDVRTQFEKRFFVHAFFRAFLCGASLVRLRRATPDRRTRT